jgi:predicted DNA-binding transcriptional regulator YafY
MRRADRLFRIIELLRRRKTALTAAAIGEKLEVSERTIYRDIRDLAQSGTPIEGEAGIGYRLRPGYDLPPLMFDGDEIEALVLGARVVRGFGDPPLAKAAQSALAKIASVLPKHLEPRIAATSLYVPRIDSAAKAAERLGSVREALGAKRKIRMRYRTEDGRETDRVVRPLGAFFWGRSWTLTAWCELREDFRSFRIDRAESMEVLEEKVVDEPGRTLEDFLARIGPDALELLREGA